MVKANENSSYLFYYFSKLKSIEGLEYLDVSEAQDISYIIAENHSLENLDVSSFEPKSAINMEGAFAGLWATQTITLSDNFTTTNATNMKSMFAGANQITELNVANFDTSKVTDMSYMFEGLHNVASLDLSNFNTQNVENATHFIYYCGGIVSLTLGENITFENATDISFLIAENHKLENLDASNINPKNAINMESAFAGLWSAKTITLSDNFTTTNATNMKNMFAGANQITELNVANFDTRNVTDMSHMFEGLYNIPLLDLTSFSTTAVTDMSSMFYYCMQLEDLDLSSFDINNETNIDTMFLYMNSGETVRIKVKDESVQTRILELSSDNRPPTWTTENVIVVT